MLANNQNILIIDKRNELSMKYKKLISQNIPSVVTIKNSLEGVFDYIKSFEPDLIIISDSLMDPTNEICHEIRTHIRDYRPILLVFSKSSHLDDKLKNLKAGADDFISEPIDNEEFVARVLAHLRRTFEETQNILTSLPSQKNVVKVLKRTLSSGCTWSSMLIGIDYYSQYRQIYGDLAADKLIQTFAAIIKTTIDERDFIGHLDESYFIVITVPERVDKISKTLLYAFDKVASRFYTEEDSQKGYITMFSDETIGRRVPLVSASIGIVDNVNCAYQDFRDVMSKLFSTHKLAHSQPGSFAIKDVPQICGLGAVSEYIKNKILVVEKDAALAYLITSTLEMQGNQTQAVSNYNEVQKNVDDFHPDVVIMESGYENNLQGLDVCKQIKGKNKAVKVIISTTVHNKELVLDSGADLYLPKPYDIVTLHSWVRRFLEE